MDDLGARRQARFILLLIALLAGASLCAAFPSGALAARPLARGFADDVWFTGSPSANPQWVQNTQATGANRAIFEVDWDGVEPTAPPANVDPSNPNGPHTTSAGSNARVREFAGTGIQPVFLVTNAPQWAEAPGGPASLESTGAWEPSATAYGQMAAALARRYSGTYPDPLNPGQTRPGPLLPGLGRAEPERPPGSPVDERRRQAGGHGPGALPLTAQRLLQRGQERQFR